MSEPRRSPLVAQVILLAVFLAITAVGVFTVVIPELTSDDAEDTDEAASDDAAEEPAAEAE